MPITTTPSGGPQGEFSTYTPIYSTTLSSTTSTVTFSNIPQTYTDLVFAVSARYDGAGTGTGGCRIQFNGDSGTNYSFISITGNGTSANSGATSNNPYGEVGELAQASVASGFSSDIYHVMNYSNNVTFKNVISNFGVATNIVGSRINLWRNTGPITSITFSSGSSFVSGSTFTMYGVKAAETATLIDTKATGGKVTADATYVYHTFLASDVFIPKQSLTCDILTIGGGASGGGVYVGGGGGAGGAVYSTGGTVTATPYAVVIGGGGSSLGIGTDGGNNGSNSSFGSVITAYGGGRGGYFSGTAGSSGGCGGGGGTGANQGSATQGTGSLGTVTAYGNSGGAGSTNASGGGGGIGAVGAGQTSGVYGGLGGAGLNTWSTWATATNTGTNGYYGNGGSGCNHNGYGAAAGNATGGAGQGQSGAGNTGGGGGGTRENGYKGSGGSGLVIVRYAK